MATRNYKGLDTHTERRKVNNVHTHMPYICKSCYTYFVYMYIYTHLSGSWAGEPPLRAMEVDRLRPASDPRRLLCAAKFSRARVPLREGDRGCGVRSTSSACNTP